MDIVKKQSDLEIESYPLSGDIAKIKPPYEPDRFHVSFLDLLEYHQEDMATVFKAVIHNG